MKRLVLITSCDSWRFAQTSSNNDEMGDRVGRIALFGIPLQQQSYRVDEDRAPAYYLSTDAPLYYYSFTDAYIAMAYKSLAPEDQARFDPMITGFNPTACMPPTISGVSYRRFRACSRASANSPSTGNSYHPRCLGVSRACRTPALDRILDFAAEVELISILQSDLDAPFPKEGAGPAYLDQMKSLFRRHPEATIVWAHTGMGRIVRPVKHHAATIEEMINDSAFENVYFNVSWDEVAKYFVSSSDAVRISADLISHPDCFLFGTDEVAPASQTNTSRCITNTVHCGTR